MKSTFSSLQRYVPLAVLAGILAVLAGAGMLADLVSGGLAEYRPDEPAANKAYWVQQITRKGPADAYREFVEKNNVKNPQLQHFSAHVIGEVLYRQTGIDGIAFCGSEFSFGCYHGFATLAIAEGGEDALKELDAACEKTFGPLSGCQHGLGHGVLEYVGYQHLDNALSMCRSSVYQPVPLLGCTSGVFMEYLTPLAGIAEGLEPEARDFNPGDPYAPCPSVQEVYRASCYFELGQWLRQTKDLDYGAVCGGLSETDRKYCFLGLGADFTRGWKDAETLIEKCARYAPDDELACRAGAAWQLLENGSSGLCAYEDAELAERCVSLADLTEGLDPSIRASVQ